MKKLTQFAIPLVAAALVGSTPFFALAQNAAQSNVLNTRNASQDSNTPAGSAQAQQGYHDGLEAAKLDTLAKRKIDAKSSHLYVHPPVKGADAVNQYRQSFEAGYNAAIEHGATS